jgi:hypothetical protein
MARKAGVITIDLQAGTSKFVLDLEKAKGQVREFGGHMTSSMASSSAAVRLFEGDVTHNLRAVERFMATTLGLGPLLRAAFPVVGAIAFGGVIAETGKKVYDFFKGIEQAPEKIGGAFRELNQPLELSNTGLELANARMENTLAKLNNKPENHLKVALLEAKEAAEKLAEELDQDLSRMGKLLQEQAGGAWGRFFDRFITADQTSSIAKVLHDEMVGPTGFGGFEASKAGITDVAKLKELYTQEIAQIKALYEQQFHDVTVQTLKGPVTRSQVDPGVGDLFEGVLRNLNDEMQHIQLTGKGIDLHGQVGASQDAYEQRKKDLEEIKRLTQELAQAQANQFTELEKLDVEERNQLANNDQLIQKYPALKYVIEQTYDLRQLEEYNKLLQQQTAKAEELAKQWERLGLEAARESQKFREDDIKQGTKQLEEQGKAIGKLAEEYNKLTAEINSEALRHQVQMIGYAPGASANPLTTLAQQQAVERQAVLDKYNAGLELANNTLKGGLLIEQQANLALEKKLALDRLDNQVLEKQAEIRQKGVKDFFLEMEGQAQTAGNILYQSMHEALDQVSDELAKVLTGQKTHWGKMFQQLGETMVRESIKSSLHTGLGKLGELIFGKKKTPSPHDGGWHGPKGTPDDRIYVSSDCGTLPAAPPLTRLPVPNAGDILQRLAGPIGALAGGLLGGLRSGTSSAGGNVFGVDSSVTYPKLAGGGDVNPGNSYWVGDGGEPELFSPHMAGTITPMSKLGGNTYHSYNIDARGADLGASNRIARAIEAAHASAISSSVVANSEHAKRTPQRS